MWSKLHKILTKKRSGGKRVRSMWDNLYDLYCQIEQDVLSHLHVKGTDMIGFPNWKCERRELEKISTFLGAKISEDYIRFLEFYNGLLLGQWLFFSANTDRESRQNVMSLYELESGLTQGTASDITDKMLPVVTNKNLICYLARTGEVFSRIWTDDKVLLSRAPTLISHSFREFMEECVLGTRYLEFGEEDETYQYLQWYLESQAKADAEELEKYGVCNDVDRNPTRDPRIITSLREAGRDVARQTYEQVKDWPEGTKIKKVVMKESGE